MSSEDYEIFRSLKEARKVLRAKHAIPCEDCVRLLPRAKPSLLLPGQYCRIHGWQNTKPRIPDEEVATIYGQFGVTRVKNHES